MKKFLKNPWTIGVGTTLLGFVLTVLYDIFKGKKILSTIIIIIRTIVNGICTFLTLKIKVFWIIIGLAIVILALWIYSKYLDSKDRVLQPKFLKYTEDSICGLLWAWTWEKNIYGLYEIENLHPICSKCKTPLVSEHDYYGGLKCLRCGERYNVDVQPEINIKMLISDNVKKRRLDTIEDDDD